MSAEALMDLLKAKTEENGEDFSYASCDFGLTARAYPERYQEMLSALGGAREYVEGLPWESQTVYHRLIPPMPGILVKLYETGHYSGTCYFLKTEEMIEIHS